MTGDRARSRFGLRRLAVAQLVVTCTMTVVVATCATWVRGQVLDSSQWTTTAAAIGRDPLVVDAVAAYLVVEVDELVQPEEAIAELLPDVLEPAAGPLAAELREFVGDQARAVVTSDPFQRTWAEANQLVHSQVVSLLRDDNPAFVTRDGSVYLDLGPVVDQLFDAAVGRLGELVGQPVELAGPDDAQRASQQIRLFDADQLATPRAVVQAIDVTPWLAWPVALLAGAAAVGLSRRRLRTGILLLSATTFAVVALRLGIEVADLLLVRKTAGDYRPAVGAVTGHVLGSLRTFTSVEITAGLVAVALLAIGQFGRGRQARKLHPVTRPAVTQSAVTQSAVTDTAETSATIDDWPPLRVPRRGPDGAGSAGPGRPGRPGRPADAPTLPQQKSTLRQPSPLLQPSSLRLPSSPVRPTLPLGRPGGSAEQSSP